MYSIRSAYTPLSVRTGIFLSVCSIAQISTSSRSCSCRNTSVVVVDFVNQIRHQINTNSASESQFTVLFPRYLRVFKSSLFNSPLRDHISRRATTTFIQLPFPTNLTPISQEARRSMPIYYAAPRYQQSFVRRGQYRENRTVSTTRKGL